MPKEDHSFCSIQETYLNDKDGHYLRLKDWKKIFQANRLKLAGVAILISNETDFQPKLIKRDREGHFNIKKGKIYHDDISILNMFAPNTRALTFVKEILLKLKSHIQPIH